MTVALSSLLMSVGHVVMMFCIFFSLVYEQGVHGSTYLLIFDLAAGRIRHDRERTDIGHMHLEMTSKFARRICGGSNVEGKNGDVFLNMWPR